jgi:hypothetical protein
MGCFSLSKQTILSPLGHSEATSLTPLCQDDLEVFTWNKTSINPATRRYPIPPITNSIGGQKNLRYMTIRNDSISTRGKVDSFSIRVYIVAFSCDDTVANGPHQSKTMQIPMVCLSIFHLPKRSGLLMFKNTICPQTQIMGN